MAQTLPWPANDIADWMPLWQAAGFFLATFVLEDVATIGAGLLLAAGAVSWPLAFGACFLGIWLGDAGLYALARFGGRNWFERSPLRRFSGRVATSERWFNERGTPILVFSRLIPGARLPTYLAAGFLRLPAARFLWITGVASFVWTSIVLLLVQSIGAPLLDWLGEVKRGGWALMIILAAVWVTLHLLRSALRKLDTRRLSAWLGRWRHWEFWPAWMFYPPVAIYCLWLAVKHRGLTLPTAANPGIFSGGMVGESKIATLRELMTTSPEFTAEAELLTGSTPPERLASLREICERRRISYPFILKPDIGQRGAGIKLIRDEAQSTAYLAQTNAPLLVQRFAEGPHEAGIFYYRFPDASHGEIFAITEKVFPTLTGDGHSTIEALVWRDARARFMAGTYLTRLGERRNEVPGVGEQIKLVEAGNHCQGCIFRDGQQWNTPDLRRRFDTISRQVPGFFIGRYDVRYADAEDFKQGRSFKIIELNGAASEATSIYDARNSLFAAYRVLFAQWDLVFAIGATNRGRGFSTTPLSMVWKTWRAYCKQAATYPITD
jgi:membrane protein DedA with SNARE-associated domain